MPLCWVDLAWLTPRWWWYQICYIINISSHGGPCLFKHISQLLPYFRLLICLTKLLLLLLVLGARRILLSRQMGFRTKHRRCLDVVLSHCRFPDLRELLLRLDQMLGHELALRWLDSCYLLILILMMMLLVLLSGLHGLVWLLSVHICGRRLEQLSKVVLDVPSLGGLTSSAIITERTFRTVSSLCGRNRGLGLAVWSDWGALSGCIGLDCLLGEEQFEWWLDELGDERCCTWTVRFGSWLLHYLEGRMGDCDRVLFVCVVLGMVVLNMLIE